MPTTTRAKPTQLRSKPGRKVSLGSQSASQDLPEVLTLQEAAEFLRVGQRDVESLAAAQAIPARKVGADWRFLKSALEDWLRKTSPPTGKEALLSLAGAFRDDPHLEQIVEAAYQRRGRPIAESNP